MFSAAQNIIFTLPRHILSQIGNFLAALGRRPNGGWMSNSSFLLLRTINHWILRLIHTLVWRFNYEANVVSTDRVFALELKRQFLADLKQSRELAPEQWRNRSVLRKVLEVL